MPMKKRIIVIVLTSVMTVMLCTAAAASQMKAAIMFEGNTLDTSALIDGEAVCLPVRDICQLLGYTVLWSDINGARKVTVEKGPDTVVFDLTRQMVTENGHSFSAGTHFGSGIRLISNRTYIDSGLFATVFPVNADYNTWEVLVTLERRAESSVTVSAEVLSSETEYLTATIQYPKLDGLADTTVQSAVNNMLEQAGRDALAAGQQNASDMAASIRDGYTGAVGKCETVFDYMVTYNQNNILSVVMSEYQYAGGAHGGTVQRAYTVDLAKGKVLAFSDLMRQRADYAPYINHAIRREIDRRVETGDLYEFEFAPFSDIGEAPEYYLSYDAVVFYFQEYAYFPYAAGIQEFTVAFDELDGMFAEPYAFLANKGN